MLAMLATAKDDCDNEDKEVDDKDAGTADDRGVGGGEGRGANHGTEPERIGERCGRLGRQLPGRLLNLCGRGAGGGDGGDALNVDAAGGDRHLQLALGEQALLLGLQPRLESLRGERVGSERGWASR